MGLPLGCVHSTPRSSNAAAQIATMSAPAATAFTRLPDREADDGTGHHQREKPKAVLADHRGKRA